MKTRIKKVIQILKKEGKHITIESVIQKSLFSNGGTLAGHEAEISEVFSEIRSRLHEKAKREEDGTGITGFAYGLLANAYFNEPNTIKILGKQ